MSKALELADKLVSIAADVAISGYRIGAATDVLSASTELYRLAAVEAELENVRRAFEQHKDNWLSWQAKRKGLEDAAAELDRIKSLEPVATVMAHPTPSVSYSIRAIHGIPHGTPLYTLEKP